MATIDMTKRKQTLGKISEHASQLQMDMNERFIWSLKLRLLCLETI